MDYIQKMIDTRQDNDDSQRDLAKKIGKHNVQIARYETRKNAPTIEYLKKFCELYGVSADYILGLPKGMEWPREDKGNYTK